MVHRSRGVSHGCRRDVGGACRCWWSAGPVVSLMGVVGPSEGRVGSGGAPVPRCLSWVPSGRRRGVLQWTSLHVKDVLRTGEGSSKGVIVTPGAVSHFTVPPFSPTLPPPVLSVFL